MTTRISQPVATTLPTATTTATTTAADKAPSPMLKAPPFGRTVNDGFEVGHPIVGGGCFPPPPPNLKDVIYQGQLRNMSDTELQGEKFNQQLRLLVSQFTGDTRGAADARHKLGMIEKEQNRREFGGDFGMKIYKAQLRNMSTPQLHAEERKQFGAYLTAMLRGDSAGAERAQQKLEAVRSELDRREPFFPFDPVWKKGIDTRM
ncbi:MAG TPA: hypothetical protein VK420_10345 [Longimicrobium sp.]|nr:hypothetical protein [Longimicrobium sp.]